MEINRRDWMRLALAGTGGLAAGAALFAQRMAPPVLPAINSTFNGVILGCNTYSLTRVSLDEAIQAIVAAGFGEAELHPRHIEPTFGARAGGNAGPGGGASAGGVAGARGGTRGGRAVNPEDREKLRQWRLTVPLEEFEAAGKKFRDHGLYLYAYNANYPADDFTDAEIDRTFEMTKALGAMIMTPATGRMATFRRLDPFARKHKIRYGIHNENDLRTPADFDEVRKGLSDYAAITLDIGHFWAAGSDPVDFLRKNRDDIVNVHIKDRKRTGATLPFGEGDTPIKESLHVLRELKYHVPAAIEYENRNLDPVEGLRNSFEYCKQILLA